MRAHHPLFRTLGEQQYDKTRLIKHVRFDLFVVYENVFYKDNFDVSFPDITNFCGKKLAQICVVGS